MRLKGAGVRWIRKVNTYRIQESLHALREAMTTIEAGPEADRRGGRVPAQPAAAHPAPGVRERLRQKKRYVRERFGIDEDTCTGDRSCIRLSGCPSLTVKDNPDPLQQGPGGHRGQQLCRLRCLRRGGPCRRALCPSFYKADIVYNPSLADRSLAAARSAVISALQGLRERRLRRLAF